MMIRLTLAKPGTAFAPTAPATAQAAAHADRDWQKAGAMLRTTETVLTAATLALVPVLAIGAILR